MKFLIALALATIPLTAQSPSVQLTNVSRPGNDFQTGDRFELLIVGTSGQPVSIRTTRANRTDWSPVIGRTDITGQWSTSGQFDQKDFGNWSEIWTVGGKLASPAVHFWVGAPCLRDKPGFLFTSGPNSMLSCGTAFGPETFNTPSDGSPLRTPDGRLLPGRERSQMTAEEYHAEIVECLMSMTRTEGQAFLHGDEAGTLIARMIGVNALTEDEIRGVLWIVRDAFAKPETIPDEAKIPSQTLALLQTLENMADREALKREIADTIAFLDAQ